MSKSAHDIAARRTRPETCGKGGRKARAAFLDELDGDGS
jgi:hypothetical protein